MVREVVTLLRELRPEEGLGEGIDQLAALVHHAYLFWDAGEHGPSSSRLEQLLLSDSAAPRPTGRNPFAYYVQIPERRIWATVIAGRHPSPSTAVSSTRLGRLEASECWGYSGSIPSGRVSAWSRRPEPRRRLWAAPTGRSSSAPTLPGGKAARALLPHG